MNVLDPYLSEADFKPVAAAAFATAGITPQEPIHYGENPELHFRTATAHDQGGLLDAHVIRKETLQGVPATNEILIRNPHCLPALLKWERMNWQLEVGGTAEDPNRHRVEINIIPSSEGVNAAQKRLGREPGTDAFRLRTKPDKGLFMLGEWLTSFAQMEVPVADLPFWEEREHDLAPTGHGLGWITTPPEICRAIVDTADGFMQEYTGDPTFKWPAAAHRFAAALEGVGLYSGGLFKVISDAANLSAHETLDFKALWDYAAPSHRKDPWKEAHRLIGEFQALGIITPYVRWREAVLELRKVGAQYIHFIAGLLLTYEEICPAPETNLHERAMRLGRLVAIKQAFAPSAD